MSNSLLYDSAVARLGSRGSDWADLLGRIDRAQRPRPPNENGADVAEIIQTENHLSSDPASAEPSMMAELLGMLLDAQLPDDPSGMRDGYNTVMGSYALRGRNLANQPAQSLRYINGPELFTKGIRKGARTLPASLLVDSFLDTMEKLDRGEGDPNWNDVLAEVQDPAVWDHLPKGEITLGRPNARSIFVTFEDTKAPVNRNSAEEMHAALALPMPRPVPPHSCFIEATLPADGQRALRMPTLADAEWSSFFRSAEPHAPHGRTRPHGRLGKPTPLPQPEAVREVPTLAELSSSSDLRILPM